MDGAVRTPADLLADDVLVYSELGAVGVVASVFGLCIEGFLWYPLVKSSLGAVAAAAAAPGFQAGPTCTELSKLSGCSTHLNLAMLRGRSLVVSQRALVLLRSRGRANMIACISVTCRLKECSIMAGGAVRCGVVVVIGDI